MVTKVQGRDAVRALLKKLTPTVAAGLQASMTASANDLADLMRSRAPVKSGALKASIRTEALQNGRIGAAIRAGGPTTTKPVRNGKSPQYDYAAGIELGTQEMLAHPYFYPSYRAKKTAIRRNASIAVQKAVATLTP